MSHYDQAFAVFRATLEDDAPRDPWTGDDPRERWRDSVLGEPPEAPPEDEDDEDA